MSKQEDFINQIAPYVQKWQKEFKFGVVSAIIGQACLESAYGTSDKAKHFNYFGLKYKVGRVTCNDGYFTSTSAEQKPDGSYVKITCKWFNFSNMDTGVEGYFQFIKSGPYKLALSETTPEGYLTALKSCGYATSINYVNNVMRVIDTYDLRRFDGPMYTNSPLVDKYILTDHNYGLRTHAIDTITIHHMAGNLSIETCGNLFKKKQGSSNYGVGTDGRIGCYVPESNAAWTSSNKANDERAITIEVANNTLAPYWTVSDKALNSTIQLVADICRRNGIQKLVWSADKKTRVNHTNGANMTMHCDFASTACPGPYLKSLMGNIALAVNNLLQQSGYILNGYDYSPVFDPEYYANRYPDLKEAFGNDSLGLWNHFVAFGMSEFRRASAEFDPQYYYDHNPDVVSAYGGDRPMYYAHYVIFGKAEGRKGAE